MVRKSNIKKGGSPASKHVLGLLKDDCKLAVEKPIGSKVNTDISKVSIYKTSGGSRRKRRRTRKSKRNFKVGGSPASKHVLGLLKSDCKLAVEKPIGSKVNTDISKVSIYKTSGGSRRRRTRKTKRNIKLRGGSDWKSVLYSRGPVNNPGQSQQFFRQFNKTSQFVPNDQTNVWARIHNKSQAQLLKGGRKKSLKKRKKYKK